MFAIGRILVRPYITWLERTFTFRLVLMGICALLGFDLNDLHKFNNQDNDLGLDETLQNDPPPAIASPQLVITETQIISAPPPVIISTIPKSISVLSVASTCTDYSDAVTLNVSPTPPLVDVDLNSPHGSIAASPSLGFEIISHSDISPQSTPVPNQQNQPLELIEQTIEQTLEQTRRYFRSLGF